MSRPGWNRHGWWIGPPELEPERKPNKAKCDDPKLCRLCDERIKWYAPDPEGLPVTTCEYCSEAIIWGETAPNPNARTAAKRHETKKIPFDAEATEHGRWALAPRPNQHPLVGEMRPGMAAGYRASGRRTFQRHVKTCVKVKLWPKGDYIVAAREKRA